MNLEKLKRLQSQVRIGGKGTPRRKKKVIHQTAAADDKKLQSSLKKLSVNTIPGIEEVNIIKDDLTVIHFKNPKAQASLSANTFAVTGHGETKKIVEMLPEILPQLGQETVVQLRMFANSMTNNQRTGPVGDLAGSSLIGTTDDDDVPQLVNDFDEIANREEITKTEIKPKIETPANVTVSKVEAANGEMNKPQQNVSTKGTESTGSNMEASIPMPDAILKTSEVVKGEDKVQKECVNKTESTAPKEIGGNKELSDKQKNKKNVEKGPAQEKHSKSPPKDKKPIGEKPDMNQEKNNHKPSAQKQKPEMKKEEIPKASDDSVQPADKAAKVPDAKKPEVTPSSSQVKPAPGAEIAPATPSPAAPTTMLLSQVIKNQMPIPQSEKPPAENRKQPEVAKELPKGPASNHTAIQAEQPKLEEPLVKKDSVKEESTPKPMENIIKPEHAAVTVQSADKDQQMKAVPLPAESKTESLSANQQNEPKKEIVPIIPSRIDVAKAMEPVKPIAPETLLATSVPEEKKAPCDDKTQAAPAQAQTTTDTVSKEIGKLDKDKAMELKAQQKQGATKKEPAKQQQQLQAKQSCPSPPATKTLPDSKKPEVAPKPKQVPVSPKPQAQQASTPPNAAPKSQPAPAKSPTGSIKSQEKQAVAPKPKPTGTAPPKPRATTPPTKPTTAPAKKKSMSPPGTKKPTTDASANNSAKEPVKKAQGSPEETKAQPNPEGTKAQGGVEQTVGSPAASTKKISTESPAKIKSESVTKAPGSTEQTAGGAEKPKKTSETKNSATKAATKVQGNAEPAAKPRPEISSPKPKPAKSPAPKTAPSSKPSPPKAPEDPSKKPPQ